MFSERRYKFYSLHSQKYVQLQLSTGYFHDSQSKTVYHGIMPNCILFLRQNNLSRAINLTLGSQFTTKELYASAKIALILWAYNLGVSSGVRKEKKNVH